MKPIYTLYVMQVPYVNHKVYMHFMNNFPEMDVSDFDEETNELWVGINYDNADEHDELVDKLNQEIKDYYERFEGSSS